jgi:hypothetical protein
MAENADGCTPNGGPRRIPSKKGRLVDIAERSERSGTGEDRRAIHKPLKTPVGELVPDDEILPDRDDD